MPLSILPINRCMARIVSSSCNVTFPHIGEERCLNPIIIEAPIFDTSGYASSIRNLLRGLICKGIQPSIQPRWFKGAVDILPGYSNSETTHYFIIQDEYGHVWKFFLWISCEEIERLTPFIHAFPGHGFFIIHMAPYSYGIDHFQEAVSQNPGHKIYIGSTMYETDRIPENWVRSCNRMDQVWVPSAFNVNTFANSGVAYEKIRKVPLGVDTTICRPGLYMKIRSWNDQFVFLSIFEWCRRKGWDILIKAFCLAFDRHDQVILLLRCSAKYGVNIRKIIHDYMKKERLDTFFLSKITILEEKMHTYDLLSLYESCDCFVLPSRGEGWGMPYLEAMAFGKAVIGTNWGGNTEFMTKQNSFLIEIEGEEHLTPQDITENVCLLTEHKYANPSLDHLIQLMRTVYFDTELRETIGHKAFLDAHYRWDHNKYAKAALHALI